MGNPANNDSDWGLALLGEVTEVTISNVDKKTKTDEIPVRLCNYTDVYYNQYIRSEMDFMDATATDREISRCSLFEGDVVITKDSEKDDDIGVPAYVSEDIDNLVCGYHLVILRPRPDKIDGKYLFYSLSAREAEHQFHARANGVTRFGLRKADIGTVTVPLPPLPEQRRIAHVLGALDDKIELNRRMNETLEEMARAVFKDWFVDYGPVRAKVEGQEAYLPEDVWRLFPDRLVESELGLVPEGWGVKSLDQALIPTNERVGDADVPEYSCTNTGLHPRADRFKKRLSSSKSKNKVIRDGDLVFGLSRQILNFGLMRDSIGCVSPAYKVFRVDRRMIVPDLLERLMRIKIDYYYGAVSASSREGQSISSGSLGYLKMLRPQMEVQDAYYDFIRRYSIQLEHLMRETDTLSALRDCLLPGLVSGEVGSVNRLL